MKKMLKVTTIDGQEHLMDLNVLPLDMIMKWVRKDIPEWLTVGNKSIRIKYVISMESVEVEGYLKGMYSLYKTELRSEVINLLNMWREEKDSMAEETASDPDADKQETAKEYTRLRKKILGMVDKLVI